MENDPTRNGEHQDPRGISVLFPYLNQPEGLPGASHFDKFGGRFVRGRISVGGVCGLTFREDGEKRLPLSDSLPPSPFMRRDETDW